MDLAATFWCQHVSRTHNNIITLHIQYICTKLTMAFSIVYSVQMYICKTVLMNILMLWQRRPKINTSLERTTYYFLLESKKSTQSLIRHFAEILYVKLLVVHRAVGIHHKWFLISRERGRHLGRNWDLSLYTGMQLFCLYCCCRAKR